MPRAPLELPPPLVHGFGAQTSPEGNSYQLRAEAGPGPELEEMVVPCYKVVFLCNYDIL